MFYICYNNLDCVYYCLGAEDSLHVPVVAVVRGTQLPDIHDARVGVHRSPIECYGRQCGNELRRWSWDARVHVRHVRRADGPRALCSARVSLQFSVLNARIERFLISNSRVVLRADSCSRIGCRRRQQWSARCAATTRTARRVRRCCPRRPYAPSRSPPTRRRRPRRRRLTVTWLEARAGLHTA